MTDPVDVKALAETVRRDLVRVGEGRGELEGTWPFKSLAALDALLAEVDRRGEALSFALTVAVSRWHETCPNEERGLREWLEMPEEVWPDYVMNDVTPEVIAALAAAGSPTGPRGEPSIVATSVLDVAAVSGSQFPRPTMQEIGRSPVPLAGEET